jgi:hypothetical protein
LWQERGYLAPTVLAAADLFFRPAASFSYPLTNPFFALFVLTATDFTPIQ